MKMKLPYQLVVDQIDENNLIEIFTYLEDFSKQQNLRVRFKKDGRTSSSLRNLSDVILDMLKAQ